MHEHLLWPRDWNAPIPDDVRGLIFDCDGTLIDSMPLHYSAWCKTLARHNVEVPEDFFYSMAGVPTIGIASEFARKFGILLDAEAAAKEKERFYLASLAEVEPIHRVVEIAKREKGKRKMAVASGGWQRVVRQSLGTIGLADLFDVYVGADDVVHGKPAPDVFLKAAELMGLPPSACVVYEDGEPGFVAAKAAGMRLIDVRPWYLPRKKQP